MPDRSAIVHIVLEPSSSRITDPEKIEETVVLLEEELRELGIQPVGRVSSGVPKKGAKTAEVLTVGAIAVAVVPEMLKDLVKLVFTWLQHDSSRSIKVREKRSGGAEYEISGSWKPEQLVEVLSALARTQAKAQDNG